MQVRIKRLNDDILLPQYHTEGAVAFDIAASRDTYVGQGSLVLVPTGLIVQVPENYMLMLSSRSSTPRKFSVIMPHGVGIIDQDYCGPEDELKIQVMLLAPCPYVKIYKGDRIAQGMFVRVDKAEWIEEEILVGTRGGFGSTG